MTHLQSRLAIWIEVGHTHLQWPTHVMTCQTQTQHNTCFFLWAQGSNIISVLKQRSGWWNIEYICFNGGALGSKAVTKLSACRTVALCVLVCSAWFFSDGVLSGFDELLHAILGWHIACILINLFVVVKAFLSVTDGLLDIYMFMNCYMLF